MKDKKLTPEEERELILFGLGLYWTSWRITYGIQIIKSSDIPVPIPHATT